MKLDVNFFARLQKKSYQALSQRRWVYFWVWIKIFLKQTLESREVTLSITFCGIELVIVHPFFEFHIIIDSGIDVLQKAKVTNLHDDYKQNSSKVVMHIFDLFRKTMEFICNPRWLNKNLQPFRF